MIEQPIEPPEQKEKQYIVRASCSCIVDFYVYAKNKYEVMDLVSNNEYDDMNINNIIVENIESCVEYNEI